MILPVNKSLVLVAMVSLISLFHCCEAAEVEFLSKAELLKAANFSLNKKVEEMLQNGRTKEAVEKIGEEEFSQRAKLLMARYTSAIALMKKESYSPEEVSEITSSVSWHLGTSASLLDLSMESLKEWTERSVGEYSVTLNEARPSKEDRLAAVAKFNAVLLQIRLDIKALVEKRSVKIHGAGVANSKIDNWYRALQFNEELNKNEWIKTLTRRFIEDSIEGALEWQESKAETYANNWLYGSRFVTLINGSSFPVKGYEEKLRNIVSDEMDREIGDRRPNSTEEEKGTYVFSDPKSEFDSIIEATVRRLVME